MQQGLYSDKKTEIASDNDRIKDFLAVFSRGIKTSLLYPPDNPIPAEFRQSSWLKLRTFLDKYHQLDLDVYPESFKIKQYIIFVTPKKDENLAGIFYRHGIRQLTFMQNLTRGEWFGFFDTVVTVSDGRGGQNDLANLLWQHDFINIEYEVTDAENSSDLEAEFAPGSAIKKVNYTDIIRSELGQDSASAVDIFNPEKQKFSVDAARKLNKYHDIFGNIQEFSDKERDYIEILTSGNETQMIDYIAIDLLFKILEAEKELSNFDASIDTINIMMDRMFEEEQFSYLVYLIRKLRESLAVLEKDSPVRTEKLRDCYSRTGDRIRIGKISNILNRSGKVRIDNIQMYIEELDWESLNSLIWMLGELEYFPSRRMLIRALVNKGRERIDLIGNAVYDSRWYVIRNAVLILGEMRDERGLPYLRKPIEHFDVRVRWEAVVAIEKISIERGYQLLIDRLEDEDARIRRKVLDILAVNHYKPAFSIISKVVLSGNLAYFDPEEQKDWLISLGAVGGDDAIPILKKKLRKKTLFSSEKNMRQKELVIIALANTNTPSAHRYLNEISRKRGRLGNFAGFMLEKLDGVNGQPKGNLDA